MSALYSSVEEMDMLAKSEYAAVPAAFGGAFPELKAVPKISKALVAYLAGLAIVAPYSGGASDKRAGGLAEEHAEASMKDTQPLSREAYVDYLARKLGDWYRDAPKSERHSRGDDQGGDSGGDGEHGGGGGDEGGDGQGGEDGGGAGGGARDISSLE